MTHNFTCRELNKINVNLEIDFVLEQTDADSLFPEGAIFQGTKMIVGQPGALDFSGLQSIRCEVQHL